MNLAAIFIEHTGSPAGDWAFWRRWTLFTGAGELIGFAAPALAMAAGTIGSWPDSIQVVAALLAGVVEGAVLGVAQWLALRPSLPPSGL
jgi:hypothetical protein